MISSYFFRGVKDKCKPKTIQNKLAYFIVKEMPICVTDSAFFQIANRLALKLAESMGFAIIYNDKICIFTLFFVIHLATDTLFYQFARGSIPPDGT